MPEDDDSAPPAGPDAGPEPPAIRFFGTSWVHHDDRYLLRRVAVGVGSLVLAAAVALLWGLVVRGIEHSQAGAFATVLMVAALVVCSFLAVRRAWALLTRETAAAEADRQSMSTVMFLGAVGGLLAYFVRNLVEAPGEGLRRREFQQLKEEDARHQHARRRARAARAARARKRREGPR